MKLKYIVLAVAVLVAIAFAVIGSLQKPDAGRLAEQSHAAETSFMNTS